MKKSLTLLGLVSCMLLAYAQAGTDDQYLKQAYQPATVVSITNQNTSPEFSYDIGIRMNCMLYVGRYKSANDALPVQFVPDHSVNVLVDGHWMRVALSSERPVELRVMSAKASGDKSCGNNLTGSSAAIPPGTILPVSLDSTMRSDRTAPGTAITATIMQDVPLSLGTTLRAGSKITGRVVEAVQPGQKSDEAKISFQFDQVRLGNRTVPIATNLRTLASLREVRAAQDPENCCEDISSTHWNLVQIGGDQTSYGNGGPVMVGSEVVGEYTSQGVLAYVGQNLGTECRATIDRNTRPQAFWVFSVNACGAYGFGDVRIAHSGRTEPVGEITLVSDSKALKVGKGSAMLLRVDRSGSETAEALATPAQAARQ